MSKVAVVVVALLLLAGCENRPSKKPKGIKGPNAAVVQVCNQVNAGARVSNPLPMGLPFALEQAVKEYQASYGRGENSGLVGRIRTQCRKEGVAL